MSAQQKLDIIDRVKKGATKASLAKIYNVSKSLPLSGPMICSKAMEINNWLFGEKPTADYHGAAKFKAELDGFILEEGYEHVNIYNADESGLYWKCLPS